MQVGRLFHARATVTRNDRSPMVLMVLIIMQLIIGNSRTDAVLELVDVVGEVEDHQSSVLQSDLTDQSIVVVVNADLLLRLRRQHTTSRRPSF